MDNLETLQDFYRTIWIGGRLDQMDRFFAPDARAGGLLPDLALGPADFEILVQTVMALVANPQIEIVHHLAQGDWIAALIDVHCRSRATGDPVRLSGQIMCRFDEGRIVEAYNHFDTMAFFQQLGLVAPETVEVMLAGDAAL
ncbi:hypothetical protein OCGS_2032 [Oceaniovalibus guishaninsula JLT2003]|uniref:SnoaL-like domain-containing protein n=1 Tax=Oceaniovalibus guishaninsula JLT2003 TaxID=1231392 RepID=K2GMZ3_9RHOB|nr:nuclear transport factor 2 family protein [Oceaniovalibus guishaninsula]EKE44051.1 hypothetical protein OCGS_2032 [Oceaniovalibus guishaninsula JLT2003]